MDGDCEEQRPERIALACARLGQQPQRVLRLLVVCKQWAVMQVELRHQRKQLAKVLGRVQKGLEEGLSGHCVERVAQVHAGDNVVSVPDHVRIHGMQDLLRAAACHHAVLGIAFRGFRV